MIRSRQPSSFGLVLVFALGALLAAGQPLQAADRSVTILEGVEEPPPDAAPPPAGAAPLTALKTENPAGVVLNILPNGNLHLGAQIALTVSTQRPGFIVIVDINAEGRWTQIYPNMLSLSRTAGDVATANLIRPGSPVTIPNLTSPLARFVFKADPPRGNGAIVAILSDRPVQIIDLPETPASPTNLQAAVDALAQSVIGLKIASSKDARSFSPGVWSFAAAPYTIE
ncbi:DUF4384 domain-containing protein [Lichenifustis flavocetrariae]|uniref:DUF4384 domain-containing protein n=1 Tax=Lichenifustis flavocetrariae TaxID=2949735 RepID=A0AA41YTV1_9HYPH|nr:DUF4384 domain-containing protein [Lichenifustis flavocetrariae]MCW6506733.1 DUF4384 domain-containing protein [Lichenifustis flavocetrariae]